MTEHQMCCGTTCDKNKLADEIKARDARIADLERVILEASQDFRDNCAGLARLSIDLQAHDIKGRLGALKTQNGK